MVEIWAREEALPEHKGLFSFIESKKMIKKFQKVFDKKVYISRQGIRVSTDCFDLHERLQSFVVPEW